MTTKKVISFYSFKGGVGRSLAMANLAYLRARAGERVLMVDFDLEAPGLQHTPLFKGTKPQKGLLEFMEAFHDHVAKTQGDILGFDWSVMADHIIRSPLNDEEKSPKVLLFESGENHRPPGGIYLMPAGKQDPDYEAILAQWNWSRFYDLHQSGTLFFSMLKETWLEQYDTVLVDSRTGLSDVFFISTLSLADAVVLVFGLNRQNMAGTQRAIRYLTSRKAKENYGEKQIALAASLLPGGMDPDKWNAIYDQRLRAFPLIRGFDISLGYCEELALDEYVFAYDRDRLSSLNPKATTYLGQIEKLDRALSEGMDVPTILNRETEITNPFKVVRVEYEDPEVWQPYFVDPGGKIKTAAVDFMPAVIEGSRGSGKTMLARSLSYDFVLAQFKAAGQSMATSDIPHIGLYFRVDVDILRSFDADDELLIPVLDRLFGQFWDIMLFRKALKAVGTLGGLSAWLKGDEDRVFRMAFREFAQKPPHNVGLGDVEDLLEDQLAEMRIFLNNPETRNPPFYIQPNVLMKRFIEIFSTANPGNDQFFIVLIDEYENFMVYQQKMINTRLKQVKKQDRITYKLFMRNEGLRTTQTLTPSQPMEITHDYRQFSLDDFSYEDFCKMAKLIANKHLQLNGYFLKRGHTDIESFFESLSPKEEAFLLSQRKRVSPLTQWFKKHYPRELHDQVLTFFNREPDLLRQAVVVVLLNQGKPVDEVLSEFTTDSKRARDWFHNYHRGALFWLCRLFGVEKQYTGFRDIAGISGQNIRTALDLCYAVVEHWIARGAEKLPVPAQLQTTPIREQCQQYKSIIRSIMVHAQSTQRFVERLGRICEGLHKGERQSEPEINHFYIRDEKNLEESIRKKLDNCVKESVLKRLKGNKQKSLSDLRMDAYQLHPRFAPIFNISWRRKKRLTLTADQIRILFSGTDTEFKALFSIITAKSDAKPLSHRQREMF